VARIATPVKTNLTVQTPPGFNFRSVIDSHGWVQLVPFGYDRAVPDTLRYTLGLRHDRAVTLSLQSRDGGVSAAVDCQLSEAERENVRSSVRQMLGLDIDLSEFYERIAGESRYAWVQGRGAGRLLAAPTAWEDLVKTLLTTNVSWTNTVSMVSRLVRYGTSASDGSFAFPTPAQVSGLRTRTRSTPMSEPDIGSRACINWRRTSSPGRLMLNPGATHPWTVPTSTNRSPLYTGSGRMQPGLSCGCGATSTI
jgi:hypothetical protein